MDNKIELFDEVKYLGKETSFVGVKGKIVEIDRAGIVTVQWGDNPLNKGCYLPGSAAKVLLVTKKATRISESNLYADEEFRTCAKCPTPGICLIKKGCGFLLPPEVATGAPLLPHDSDERKRYPLATAFLDYFPSAMVHLAHHSFNANEKHNPGQPVHWSRDKSNDHRDAAMRHLIEGDWAGLAWRAMAMLQLDLESKGHPVAPGARYSTETAR